MGDPRDLRVGTFDVGAIEDAALHYALAGPLRPNEVFAIPLTIAQGSEAGADRSFVLVPVTRCSCAS